MEDSREAGRARRMAPQRRRRLAAWLAAALALVACATNPVTGRREIIFMSPERERALGAQEAAKVAEQIGLVDDPALAAYIDGIGQRLVANVEKRLVPGAARVTKEFQFAVADMPEPNAFALPGGYIYVSRGLLALANSEDEVANVIGHEIGHVIARHSAQRYTSQVFAGVGTVAASMGAAVLLGDEAGQTVGELSRAVGAGLIASYGRDQERESDEVGQALAADTGYDPAAMADFFRSLEAEEIRVTGQRRLPSWLDSHPVTSERIADSTQRAASLAATPNPDIPEDPAAYLARLEGLLVGPNPVEGLFRGSLFLHPGLDFAVALPTGWELANQKTFVAAAEPNRRALVVLEGEPPGDPEAAARAFAQANRLALRGRATRIGGFDAYQGEALVTVEGGAQLAVSLTWIAHPQLLFRLAGQTRVEDQVAFAPVFEEVAASFRTLTSAERRSIKARRIHIVKSREGESLAQLSRRTGNAWSLAETAVANALPENARFARSRAVKITRDVPLP